MSNFELKQACKYARQLQKQGYKGGLANYLAGVRYGFTASEVGKARWCAGQRIKQYKEKKLNFELNNGFVIDVNRVNS